MFHKWQNITFIPVLHYNMESTFSLLKAIYSLSPDCMAVEAPQALQSELMIAASRLPDISVIGYGFPHKQHLLIEPCDPISEALRSSLELGIPLFCVDQPVNHYPGTWDPIPDPYAMTIIGDRKYQEECLKSSFPINIEDKEREAFIASKLLEISKYYESILYIGGFAHQKRLIKLLSNKPSFSTKENSDLPCELFTLDEESCREVMGELPYTTLAYEKRRQGFIGLSESNPLFKMEDSFPLDRKKVYLNLLKEASKKYQEATGFSFQRYHLKNLLTFFRKYAHLSNNLLPTTYQLFSGAKACVDHNYAYEVWLLGTDYPHLRNIDNLPVKKLRPDEIWGQKKSIKFHLKKQSRHAKEFKKRERDQKEIIKTPINPYSICSYQPEDHVIEGFAKHMQKRSAHILKEENARVTPFVCSLEDGIDFRETIRNIADKKIYIKSSGKPPQPSGAVVLIFDEDKALDHLEKYPWCTSWLGEHNQESDMAFYATEMNKNIIGPGIARCSYGGLMMTYPPGRLHPVWEDDYYQAAESKPELLLLSAIDYSVEPVVTYIAKKPPRPKMKTIAGSFGKRILYIPIGQLSPVTLKKIQIFHVLSDHKVREIADDYIY